MLNRLNRLEGYFSREQVKDGGWQTAVTLVFLMDDGKHFDFTMDSKELFTIIQRLQTMQLEMNSIVEPDKEKIRGAVIRGLAKRGIPYEGIAETIVEKLIEIGVYV